MFDELSNMESSIRNEAVDLAGLEDPNYMFVNHVILSVTFSHIYVFV